MAKEVESVENGATVEGYDPATLTEITWDTVHVEAGDQLVFDTIGDTYVGIYAGHELIYPDPVKKPGEFFIQLKWTDPQGSKFCNAGADLTKAYVTIAYAEDGTPTVIDKIAIGALTRTEMRKEVDTGQNDPMKSYRVDVAGRYAGNPV